MSSSLRAPVLTLKKDPYSSFIPVAVSKNPEFKRLRVERVILSCNPRLQTFTMNLKQHALEACSHIISTVKTGEK